MKVVETVYKVLVLLMLMLLVLGLYELVEKKNFYEYESSKINLLQVKKVESRVSYYATLAEDTSHDINRKFSTTLNRDELENIKSFLTAAKSSEFYNIEIVAYLLLDDTSVELYKSEKFIKYAGQYSVNEYLLRTLQNYGIDDFQYKSLLSLKGEVFTDKQKFTDAVVNAAKLKQGSWTQENIPKLGLGKKGVKFMKSATEIKEKHLSDEDIEMILSQLEKALETYEGIR
ncbi:MAG: hypothetical protein U9Q40_02575 [Campylobacterota bacterium]|nr:hypothetical protein [Campylobacterota bacterium]